MKLFVWRAPVVTDRLPKWTGPRVVFRTAGLKIAVSVEGYGLPYPDVRVSVVVLRPDDRGWASSVTWGLPVVFRPSSRSYKGPTSLAITVNWLFWSAAFMRVGMADIAGLVAQGKDALLKAQGGT